MYPVYVVGDFCLSSGIHSSLIAHACKLPTPFPLFCLLSLVHFAPTLLCVDRETFTTSNHKVLTSLYWSVIVLSQTLLIWPLCKCRSQVSVNYVYISIFRYWDRKPKSLTIAYFQTMHNLLYTMQDKISGVQVCLWTEMLALFLGLTTASPGLHCFHYARNWSVRRPRNDASIVF